MSAQLPKALPPVVPASAFSPTQGNKQGPPNVKKTIEVAKLIVNAPPKNNNVKPSWFQKKWKKISKSWKLFVEKHFPKPKSPPPLVPAQAIHYSDFYTRNIKAPASTASSTHAPIILSPVQIRQNRLDLRTKLKNNLNSLAAQLAKEPKTLQKQQALLSKPSGLNNPNNLCHMNSDLQCLEATHLSDPYLLKLLESDFIMPAGISFKEFEKQLHSWAPIQDLNEVNYESLKIQQKNLETDAFDDYGMERQRLVGDEKGLQSQMELAEQARVKKINSEKAEIYQKLPKKLQEATSDASRNFSEFDLMEYEDKILFKWSFLLLESARMYGTSTQKQIALDYHRDVAFGCERHGDLTPNARARQHDAAAYFVLWHDMLDIKLPIFSSLTSTTKDTKVDFFVDVVLEAMFPISIKKDFNSSLNEFIHLKEDKALERAGAEIKLSSKRQELDAIIFNPRKKQNLDKEIEILETSLNASPNTFRGHLQWDINYRLVGEPPEVLQFQLKRFLADERGQVYKVQEKSPVPTEKKFNELFTKESLNGKDANYRLTAFNVHQGGYGGGHYVAYVLKGDQWYYISDSTVSPRALKDVPFGDAYLLSFKKVP